MQICRESQHILHSHLAPFFATVQQSPHLTQYPPNKYSDCAYQRTVSLGSPKILLTYTKLLRHVHQIPTSTHLQVHTPYILRTLAFI